MRKIDLLNELFSLGGSGGGGGEAVEYKSFIDNGDNTITAVDKDDVEHTIAYTLNADGSFATISYDGQRIPFGYDTDGNLVSVGETVVDVSDVPVETLPTLSNPASANDVIDGKEYITGSGEKQTGTFKDVLPTKGIVITKTDSNGNIAAMEVRVLSTISGGERYAHYNQFYNGAYASNCTFTVVDATSITSASVFAYTNLNTLIVNNPITLAQQALQYGGFVNYIFHGRVTTSGHSGVFQNSLNVTKFTFEKGIDTISISTFGSCTKVVLYDFGDTNNVPSLYNVESLGHKSGCVIRVPQNLILSWKTATNWVSLSDVIWQFPISDVSELPEASADYAGVQAWISDSVKYQCNLVSGAYEWQSV